jgi:Pyrimidine dimer DNA glycosylase
MTITFLPYSDFETTAKCLDNKRLGSSRNEGWIILRALRMSEESKYSKISKAGYCLMWKGYEDALACYLNALLVEWARRGMKNDKLQPYDEEKGLNVDTKITEMPPWLGNEVIHSYHRHALLAKDSKHYRQFGWRENGKDYNGSYMWPVQLEDGSWIFRWPKATGIDPIPISTSTCQSMPLTTPTKRRQKKPSVVTPKSPTPVQKRQRDEKSNASNKRMALRSDTRVLRNGK